MTRQEAIVYCEGAFQTTNGKTAHGLVRRTERYHVICVVDSTCAGNDAGELLNGRPNGIPIVADLSAAFETAESQGIVPTHLVIGLAPDGGRLPPESKGAVLEAVRRGLHVDSGLHDFLSDDVQLAELATQQGVTIRDIRKPPSRDTLHFFSGKIEDVTSFRVAVLGTDSAIGKRTTAWVLVDGFRKAGRTAELIGTGQTAWMQGARYGVIMDSLINDFVAGEIEHAVWSAWNDQKPDVLVIEGQGSLMNPAYPGGFEILAAGRPDVVVLQHAPTRKEYDGFPGYTMHPVERQIEAIELLSGRPVVAITVNHEGLAPEEIAPACDEIRQKTGLPTVDVLRDGIDELVAAIMQTDEFQRNSNT